MAYQINKTDGTIVATVADGQVDVLSTDITLIGKNYSGFGEALNENFIKLLENFASTTRPEHPIKGQIWFDSTENKLKVYSGTGFVPVSSATISNTQPTTLGVGDLWFNDVAKQLYFFDGTDTILLGPAYSEAQGISGLIVSSILDTLNQTRVITSLYNNGILLGIFSKDSFTPKNAIEGFSGNITPGFNQGTLSGIKFNVTVTNSEKLGSVASTTYARKDTSNVFTQGPLAIRDNLGIVFGEGDQGNLTVSTTGNVVFSNSASDKQIVVNVRRGIVQEDAVVIDPTDRSIGLYSGFTDSQVNVGGNMEITGNITIRGNLVINDGSLSTINEQELVVENKYIVLAQTGDSGSNSDDIADGGGLILKGTTDHVFLWSKDGYPPTPEYPALADGAFTCSDDINLATGKSFRINGVTVLDGTSLGTGITSIPGVTSFGTQNVVNIGPGTPPVAELRLENHRISTLGSNNDIELEPDGTGNVALIGSPRITGMADPSSAQDAATKEYVDQTVEQRPLVFSMDLSDGKSNVYIATSILPVLAPVASYRVGTVARILCTQQTNSSSTVDISTGLSTASAEFLLNPTGAASAIISVSGSNVTVPGQSIVTSRLVKIFQIQGSAPGAWTYLSETVIP